MHCLLEAVLRSGALTKRCLRCIFVVEASKRARAAGAAGLKTGHPHHTWLRVFGQAILTAVKINTRYMHAKLPTGMGNSTVSQAPFCQHRHANRRVSSEASTMPRLVAVPTCSLCLPAAGLCWRGGVASSGTQAGSGCAVRRRPFIRMSGGSVMPPERSPAAWLKPAALVDEQQHAGRTAEGGRVGGLGAQAPALRACLQAAVVRSCRHTWEHRS